MNTKNLILSAFLLSSSLAFGLYDDFAGPQLDSAKWIANTPYSDSVSTLENGYLKLRNGGGIITANNQGTYINMTGQFTYTGSSYDQFGIMLRADNSLRFGSYGTFNHGIYIGFNLRSGDQGGFDSNIKIQDLITQTISVGSFTLDVGSTFNFKVLDTGSQVSVFINDFTNPVVSATTSSREGELIAFQNREGAGNGSYISAGSETHLDNISIVPEPSSSAMTLLLFAIGGCFVFTNLPQGLFQKALRNIKR